MKFKIIYKLLKNISLFIILLVAVSCNNDEQCRKSKVVKMQLGIYQVTTAGTIKTSAYLNIDSLTVKGIGIDSILYNKTKAIHLVTFPLNKFEIESKFQVTFNQIVDTVTILHTNQDTYLSLECGCIKTHTIDTVLITNHFLDSASITIHDVNTSTSAKEHIKLYH